MPDAYYGSFIKRQIKQRRFENGLATEVAGSLSGEAGSLLSGVGGANQITRRTIQAIMREMGSGLAGLYERLGEESIQGALDIASAQADSLAAALSRALGYDVIGLDEAQLARVASRVRIDGHTIGAWFNAQQSAVSNRLAQVGRAALGDGLDEDGLRERMEQTMTGQARAWAESLSRTVASTINNEAAFALAIEAEVDVYYLNVQLDTKTSDICIGWAANPGPYDVRAASSPRPPFHFNCRTTPMFAAGKFRAPRAFDARRYLDGLSFDELNRLLGKDRAAQYRAGQLDLDQLVRTDRQIEVAPRRRNRRRAA